MSNIDKQAVQAVADLKAGYTLGHADVAILNELARIALASLEAEPGEYLTHVVDDGCGEFSDRMNFSLPIGTKLYSAPPAPVSVPDDVMAAMQKVARIRLDLNDFDGDKRGILDCLGDAEEALIEVVNRRAAMLQGAEPVTTAYKLPEGYVLVPVEPTTEMMAEAKRWTGLTSTAEIVYREMITAAPQQEVK